MKTIGLIGGLSWESTAEYYRIINREVQRRLGGVHSAKIVLYSFDFAEIADAKRLSRAGADFIVICANTMHKVADATEWQSRLPVLHIADTAAAAIIKAGMTRIGLLGTAYTMEGDFYGARLREKHGITVIVPEADDRALVHRVIYEELVRGELREDSRAAYRAVIKRLVAAGAEGIVLGCTEIPLLVKAEDSDVPLFDTTKLHALAAVDEALS